MRKALLALAVLAVGLLAAVLVFQQQPTYAGVSMPKTDYENLQTSKTELTTLLHDLTYFENTKKSDLTRIQKDADKIQAQLKPNLSASDQQKLTSALFDKTHGIVGIAQTAASRGYNFDSGVAAQFHDPMFTLISLTVNGVNKSSAQRAKIETKLQKDLDIDDKLYQIGAINE